MVSIYLQHCKHTEDTVTVHLPCSRKLFDFQIAVNILSFFSLRPPRDPRLAAPHSQLQCLVTRMQAQTYGPGTMRNLRFQWNLRHLLPCSPSSFAINYLHAVRPDFSNKKRPSRALQYLVEKKKKKRQNKEIGYVSTHCGRRS